MRKPQMTGDLRIMAARLQVWQLECLKRNLIDAYYFSLLASQEKQYYRGVYGSLRGWKEIALEGI